MTAADRLRTFLDGPEAETRDAVRAWLEEPGNGAVTDLPREEHRAQVLAWARELADGGRTAIGYPVEFGGESAVGRSIAAFETLAFGDLSLLVKCGVQFGLFGGAVLHLGTRRHHAAHLAAIARMELIGCFAMTETGHGSDVQAHRHHRDLRPGERRRSTSTRRPRPRARTTSATPRATAGMAAVFAQLVVGGEPRGVHALLVPLRDARGDAAARRDARRLRREARPRRRRQRPHRVRPRARARARRCSTATARSPPTATYTSPIENPAKRFFTMLGTLVQGRVSICGASITASKAALEVAVGARARAPPVRPARRTGGAAARLPHPPAPAPARTGRHLRAALRAGAARRAAARGVHRRRGRPRAARARDARRGPQGRPPRGTRRRRSRPVARRAAASATCAPPGSPR